MGKATLNGNYQRLNGLGLGDVFGRDSKDSKGQGMKVSRKQERNSPKYNVEGLDKWNSKAKIPGNSRESVPRVFDEGIASGFMTSKPFSQPQNAGKQPCKHPRVQIVSREEDAEFVECLECREVFESSELKDMSIEESTDGEAQES
jgi:hypothetical protein